MLFLSVILSVKLFLSVIFKWFLLQSDRLKKVKTIKSAHCFEVKGDRDRLIQVRITVIKGSNFRDFDK